ncbi:hypothetical protein RFI_32821 [Reticulomyxa filosa]|uniref:Uncharacterized protein n=1 Tax=Reticulomyxa filosa TaxID=46433 RepID=X6LRR4_RETFI|nr:hypothetical protein RFI_32821 [Reticulomyxa filosa]|eukprot:ETO04578.1 hypothetical protein RFI_32821 [Reticulomyxa filosa]
MCLVHISDYALCIVHLSVKKLIDTNAREELIIYEVGETNKYQRIIVHCLKAITKCCLPTNIDDNDEINELFIELEQFVKKSRNNVMTENKKNISRGTRRKKSFLIQLVDPHAPLNTTVESGYFDLVQLKQK